MKTEDVFRSANERIAREGRELGWRFPVQFLCERSDMHCFGRVELSLADYGVRSHFTALPDAAQARARQGFRARARRERSRRREALQQRPAELGA